MFDILQIAAFIVPGWVAQAKSGSWACVHPVINKLQPAQQILFQKVCLNFRKNYSDYDAIQENSTG